MRLEANSNSTYLIDGSQRHTDDTRDVDATAGEWYYINVRTFMGEEFIGTVDVWELRQLRWPVLRAIARRFVEARELCTYERSLLSSGRWSVIRCTPHATADGAGANHLFDVYGVPASSAG